MAYKIIVFVLFFFTSLAQAAQAPRNLGNTESPVSARCVSADGLSYEACGGGAGASGNIVDGVDAGIKATVFDRTNSNPVATQLVDSNGDPVSVGGGTQYGQGSVTTDTDQLMMAGCVRADTAAVATGVIDGDRARCIVDATGRLWVHVGVIDGTVAVTGPLTDTELRATPVPISGTVTANAGTNLNTSGLLTDTQLRATPVPISGTVTATGPLTDGQLRATSVPVDTELPAAAAAADAAANPTAPFAQAALSGWNGTGWDRLRSTIANGLVVDVSRVTGNVAITAASLPLPASAATEATLATRFADATFTGRMPAGASPADNESNTNTALSRIGNFNFVFDGTTWDRWTGLVQAAQSGTWTVQPGNTANTTPWLATVTSLGEGGTADAAATVGSTGSINAKLRLITSQLDTIQTAVQLIDDDQTGASVNYRTSVGVTEDETEIKATAGRLFSISATNTNAAVRYLRCYNLTAANTTPGTSTVFLGLAIPGATTGAGFTTQFGPSGIAFGTALTCALTTGAADTDVAEVAANEIKWIIVYK